MPAGGTVLVQGAGGGVTTAAIVLAKAMGYTVWVTARTEHKRRWAMQIGADEVFETGTRLPAAVDSVMETVGAATWDHSLRSLRPGGSVVVSGATSGANPPADLNRVFFKQLSIVGSTMGTVDELERMIALMGVTGVRPIVDRVLPFVSIAEGLTALETGHVLGKIVLTM
jgi:D-arabinose 1-dehydrogenase-like Zn-dependent alcohol dehydrogenase